MYYFFGRIWSPFQLPGARALLERFQVLLRLRIILPDGADLRASVLLRAFSAGLESLCDSALSDLAQRTAEYGLGPVHTATLAVDVFRKNGRIVQFCP